jgi:hypothetical protein
MVLQDHPFRNRPLALLIEHTMSLDLLVSDIHPTITMGVAVSIEHPLLILFRLWNRPCSILKQAAWTRVESRVNSMFR